MELTIDVYWHREELEIKLFSYATVLVILLLGGTLQDEATAGEDRVLDRQINNDPTIPSEDKHIGNFRVAMKGRTGDPHKVVVVEYFSYVVVQHAVMPTRFLLRVVVVAAEDVPIAEGAFEGKLVATGTMRRETPLTNATPQPHAVPPVIRPDLWVLLSDGGDRTAGTSLLRRPDNIFNERGETQALEDSDG